MKLILGLGNPGKKYQNTRHNVGFMVLDMLAKSLEASFSTKPNLYADVAELNLDGEKCILAKPTTFMNASGKALRALMDHYKITSDDIWVIYDDAMLELGTLRIREHGSAGGHNGVKSIIHTIGSETFWRFKVGVDPPPEHVPLEDWVLLTFSKKQTKTLTKIIELTKEYILTALETKPKDQSLSLT